MRGVALMVLACGCDAVLHLERIPEPPKGIVWESVFVMDNAPATGDTHTFGAQASAAGNAIVVQVACSQSSSPPTGVTLVAPGWQFQPIGAIVGHSPDWAAAFTAIAPDSVPATFTVTWTGSASPPCTNMHDMGDEFSGTRHTNDPQTFEDHAESAGVGNCHGTVKTKHGFDAVWAACTTNTHITAPGPGYILGADDGTGDNTEWRVTTDPANTSEDVTFTSFDQNAAYAMTTIAIAANP